MFNAIVIGLMAATMQQTDTTVSVRPNARLELDLFQGSIVVRTWERNQVRVQASHGRRDVVRVSTSPTVVRIDADGRVGPIDADVEITVPASMSLDLSGTMTDISVTGVQGEIESETVNGNVTVSGGTGRVRLESVQGLIVLSNARGRIDVATVNRGIHLQNVNGDIIAETVNGAIMLERITSNSVDASTTNGTIVYDGTIRDGGNYLMSTHNGGIWLVVPQGSNATVNVSTFNGKLDPSFAVSLRESTSKRRFRFVLGSGSAQVDLETFGGDVRLRRPGESRPSFGATAPQAPKKNDKDKNHAPQH